MAELQTAANAPKSGKPQRKRLSTRVDLTPMVDLGFLLITFFIFTTTLMQPLVMKLNLPKDGTDTESGEKKTLNLVLADNNTIGYYMGADATQMQFTDYSSKGIRKQIQNAQERVSQEFGDKAQLFTVIKPTPRSSYKNVVDALDEMLINSVTRYVLTDADEKEIGEVGNK